MGEVQTVYVLESGEYSDRCVVGVFASYDAAVADIKATGAETVKRRTFADAFTIDDKGFGDVWLHFTREGKPAFGESFEITDHEIEFAPPASKEQT